MELLFESNRGCVLVAASWLDEVVESLLVDCFSRLEGSETKAFSTLLKGRHAPFGQAWAREAMVHVVGIIDRPEYNAIKAVRQLRNKYAHRFSFTVLTDHDVNEIVKHLEEDGRAIIDLVAGTINQHIQRDKRELAEPNDQFAMRVHPSPVRCRFIISFTFLLGTILRATNEMARQHKVMDKLMMEAFERMKKGQQSQPSSSDSS